MRMLDDRDLAALALTSRLVDARVKPLSPREFWALRRDVEPSALHGMTARDIAAEYLVPNDHAERIARLFDRSAALALAVEKLGHSGIWTVTGVGQTYPERLRTRLRDAAPVVLHGVGDMSPLETDGIGVVGSRNVSEEGSEVARAIARMAVRSGIPVISGAARGVDRDAMNSAFDEHGKVVGVLADSLQRAVAKPGMRKGVFRGQICLVTPFAPDVAFSVGNAMARNKIIYGLARCTVVVASDEGTGGTWAGAVEALKNGYGRVASWVGAGSGPGNKALVEQGALELADISQSAAVVDLPAPPAPTDDRPLGDQLTFGFG
jgi:predicted Rossmann fold nucleotide-binding protein DprA/Smf involved in DNA uptake